MREREEKMILSRIIIWLKKKSVPDDKHSNTYTSNKNIINYAGGKMT